MINSTMLLAHRAQTEAIHKRIYDLAEAADYQKPRGHYKPEYFIEEYDIEDGYITCQMGDPRAQDTIHFKWTFDEFIG